MLTKYEDSFVKITDKILEILTSLLVFPNQNLASLEVAYAISTNSSIT